MTRLEDFARFMVVRVTFVYNIIIIVKPIHGCRQRVFETP